MDVLFLRELGHGGSEQQAAGGDERLLTELQATLEQLRSALHELLLESRSNRKEARQWLINSIAGLDLSDASTKRRRFAQFLPGGAACRGAEHRQVAQAMLQLLFEEASAEVGALIAQDASLLRHFFKSDPKRVPLWFGHFSMEGMRRFKFGAAALAQYALANRAEMWELLAWQGRHPQAPVAVAQRPHYFCELDVPRSVRHLIKDCPGFWSSREMRQSIEEGAAQLLGLDPQFWSKELLRWLEDRRSAAGDRLHSLLCRCLEQGSWRQHCQRLLQLLPQQDLLPFATDLLGGSSLSEEVSKASSGGSGAAAGGGAWLVFRRLHWQSLDQLTLAAALGCSLPLLLRTLRDEEWEDERRAVEQLVRRLLLPPAGGADGQLDRTAVQPAAVQAHEQQQQQQAEGQQQQAEQDQQQQRPPPQQTLARQHVATHWLLRRRLAQQRSTGSEAQLHELLLLHLFAAAFMVQQLSSSGSQAEAEQLQQLLTSSGLPCELVAPGLPGSGQYGERGKRQRRSSSKHKGSKRRSSSKHKGSRKEKRRRKKRRRSGHRSSGGSSCSDSEASDSSSEDEDAASAGMLAAAAAGGESAQQRLWRVRRPDGGSSTVSSLELLDLVIDTTAWAHARWLFGKG